MDEAVSIGPHRAQRVRVHVPPREHGLGFHQAHVARLGDVAGVPAEHGPLEAASVLAQEKDELEGIDKANMLEVGSGSEGGGRVPLVEGAAKASVWVSL